jgi:hypothetical protein
MVGDDATVPAAGGGAVPVGPEYALRDRHHRREHR